MPGTNLLESNFMDEALVAETVPPHLGVFRLRVLIAEDDRLSRECLRQLLVRQGFVAEAAGTLAEAHAKLGSHGYLLLDLNLPDGLGTSLLRRVRQECPAVKIAVISGSGDEELVAEAAALRGLLLPKPLDFNRLMTWFDGNNGHAMERVA